MQRQTAYIFSIRLTKTISAVWPFLHNEFECVQTVWLFIKMSDWPFLRNTIEILTTRMVECTKIDQYPEDCQTSSSTQSKSDITEFSKFGILLSVVPKTWFSVEQHSLQDNIHNIVKCLKSNPPIFFNG